MKVNWKIRFENKTFWLTFIPATLLLIQVVLAPFGITFEYFGIEKQLIDIVNAVFTVLAILGVVVDPTTPTINDSELALNRRELENNNN